MYHVAEAWWGDYAGEGEQKEEEGKEEEKEEEGKEVRDFSSPKAPSLESTGKNPFSNRTITYSVKSIYFPPHSTNNNSW